MKALICGDLHSMPSNLEDTGIILDLVKEKAKGCDAIIFLGDIFHTHAVVRQEAAHLVKRKVMSMTDLKIPIFLMAGNHDGQSPHSVQTNAVRLVFGGLEDEEIYVVDNEDGFVMQNFFMLPFIGDNERFVKAAQNHANKILLCHQTVIGAHYENKHLADGGVDQRLLPQKYIVAGHIHTTQQVGKVFYPGTPRALTANEFNQSKAIWTFDGNTLQWDKIPTDGLVKRFVMYEAIEGKPLEYDFKQNDWQPKDDVAILITGSEQFYRDFLKEHEYLGDRVRFVPNIRKSLKNSLNVEASGSDLRVALSDYVFNIYEAEDEMKGKIWRKLQGLIPNLGDRG